MKARLLVTFFMFMSFFSFAQEQALELTNKYNSFTKNIKENTRIKVWTSDGEVYGGKFKIIDDTHIQLKSDVIPLNEIEKIKEKKFFITLVKIAVLAYGAIQIGAAFLVADSVGIGISLLTGIGAIGTGLYLFDVFEIFQSDKEFGAYNYQIINLE